MSWPLLMIGLSASTKLYLNFCSRRWLRPSLGLASNSTPLGLWRTYEFQKIFLENIQIFWVEYISVQLVPFNNYRREKRVSEKVMFYFELRNISISCFAWFHGSRNNILKRCSTFSCTILYRARERQNANCWW